ncbi:hypothetical protein HDE76_004006 [Rhodanobacter sp. ANJX3]|uniref:hypothetical protein n=1 Tax=Rhodanobacter sp. ANJX3 TaxID=2723083 RepID=UPI00161BD94C|nr:hypothetical protein [Rhodanobacter sp. ANJX3]MBB5360758.1 hypothetical protein [Rhodanobacter sp. ANJX3]
MAISPFAGSRLTLARIDMRFNACRSSLDLARRLGRQRDRVLRREDGLTISPFAGSRLTLARIDMRFNACRSSLDLARRLGRQRDRVLRREDGEPPTDTLPKPSRPTG